MDSSEEHVSFVYEDYSDMMFGTKRTQRCESPENWVDYINAAGSWGSMFPPCPQCPRVIPRCVEPVLAVTLCDLAEVSWQDSISL